MRRRRWRRGEPFRAAPPNSCRDDQGLGLEGDCNSWPRCRNETLGVHLLLCQGFLELPEGVSPEQADAAVCIMYWNPFKRVHVKVKHLRRRGEPKNAKNWGVANIETVSSVGTGKHNREELGRASPGS